MRTPNCECVICSKPLYRRPCELKKVRYVVCMKHRAEAQIKFGITEKQKVALELGRKMGTNNRQGYKHTEETKRKISQSHKTWCKENPDKVKMRGKKIRGVSHYNWKGGTSQLNLSIRTLTENRKWMNAVKERDKKCVKCGSQVNLESHHIIPVAELIEKYHIKNREQARNCSEFWDLDNGVTVCQKCHYKIHGRNYEN